MLNVERVRKGLALMVDKKMIGPGIADNVECDGDANKVER